jgi:crotonobetainyl-CoA:carnitine CoA-transferase CaiB-like acyl-CoA transferase
LPSPASRRAHARRISAWAVYDVFTVKDGEQIFLAAVSDAQWAPALGAQTHELLRELGYDDERITQLAAEAVVGEPTRA